MKRFLLILSKSCVVLGGIVLVIGFLLLAAAVASGSGDSELFQTLGTIGAGVGVMRSSGIVYLLSEIAEYLRPKDEMELEVQRLTEGPSGPRDRIFSDVVHR